jgi:hypothetical protein
MLGVGRQLWELEPGDTFVERLRSEDLPAAAYNIVVKRRAATTTPKNGASRGTTVSPLGRDLSKIAERIASSGIKPLSRKEVAREVSERRGGR